MQLDKLDVKRALLRPGHKSRHLVVNRVDSLGLSIFLFLNLGTC